MNIVIDSGNTYSKVGWFQEEKLLRYTTRLTFSELIEAVRSEIPEYILFSSVSYTAADFENALGKSLKTFELTPETPLPITKNYDTPQTLGADRIAASAGANFLYPGEDLVVIDMGTCITYDLIDKNAVFQGGLISPGVKMRFNAMHSFTKRLPLVEPEPGPPLIGKSTRSAMQSGVMNGVLAEIQGIIEQYRHNSPDLRVLLCGGDAAFFESSLKPPIFAVPELVLIGLNRILTYNVSLQ
ncbi:type III pantothenate kinase [Dyadobacter chenwenxiniae]|uniref:Type III pantothenate kinase n=1 Tax=Dyadobacter chenwenxiniae TaxID=2906456 RepID=A0A9X1PIG1_9BACT|nr:type III pantothenate kinase [Dyadobacter chenwenxiniae]MCF0060679.1 type III pantothenate kinase [Dyadobacter chenwenxiniae]UON80513.1 type III pantothenate kinase [Dyadobacter chenwenxiniae]